MLPTVLQRVSKFIIFIKNNIRYSCYIFLIIANICHAQSIKIIGKTIISKPTVYKNVDLDLTEGYFYILNNASLTIQDSTIQGTISPTNPALILLGQGQLIMERNQVNVGTEHIPLDPTIVPPYQFIFVMNGNVQLKNNSFSIFQPYAAVLLSTSRTPTTDFILQDNIIHTFHGGFYLTNSKNALISGNHFWNTSNSNIFMLANSFDTVKDNVMTFAGNNYSGDGIDVVNSDHILVTDNSIYNDTCYAILITSSQNIIVDKNIIADGVTYAIFLTPTLPQTWLKAFPWLKSSLNMASENISITNNYLLQNRYGLSATNVIGLIVKNNLVSERFKDAHERQFWTNNDNMFQNIQQITWDNNWYRESFSQEINGSNELSYKFVSFPLHNGIIL